MMTAAEQPEYEATSAAIAPTGAFRELGSFEKMLTQTRESHTKGEPGPTGPGMRTLTQPHIWAAVLNGDLMRPDLLRGVVVALNRHPMLRVCIRKPNGEQEPVKNLLGEVRDDGDPLYFCSMECSSMEELASQVVDEKILEVGADADSFESAWQKLLEENIDTAAFDISRGPNWRVQVVYIAHTLPCRLYQVCTMNHALEDQRSCNILLQDILRGAAGEPTGPELPFPGSMESSIVTGETFRPSTFGYLLSQAMGALSQPVLLGDNVPPEEVRGSDPAFGRDGRKTICEFAVLEGELVQRMLQTCRSKGVTLTAALCAASLMACSQAAHQMNDDRITKKYKFLMAVDLRRFGVRSGEDWTNGTVACAGGALDFFKPTIHTSAPLGRNLIQGHGKEKEQAEETFWRLARQCKQVVNDFEKKGIARESVAVFDWAMNNMDIWESVNIESRNTKTLGRAYTCGLSNMGRFPYDTEVGPFRLEKVHYATSHARCGSLFQLSCGTVDDKLCMTCQVAEPVVTREAALQYLNLLIESLKATCAK
ncbi:unnamed protein product [Chrysoparadoxa australica]